MIIADLIGKRLEGIDGSLSTLKLIFEGGIELKLYPYTRKSGVEPEIAWVMKSKEEHSEGER